MRVQFFVFLFLTFCGFLFSQNVIIDKYPPDQDAYLGGKDALYQDLHKILKEQEIKVCDSSEAWVKVKVLVKEDASINIVAPEQQLSPMDQCAYNVAKKALPYLKDWQPLELQGKKFNTIFEFDFFPNDLVKDIPSDYGPYKTYRKMAEFPGGIIGFRNEFSKRLEVPDLPKGTKWDYVIKFEITELGTIENIIVTTKTPNPKFEKNIRNAIGKIKTKWTPAELKGKKVSTNITMPFSMNYD